MTSVGPQVKGVKNSARSEGLKLLPWAATALAVWLGWQVALQPVKDRAPAAVAIRAASGSPLVLTRAAEAELAGNRLDNASSLARSALEKAPFNVRALRVLGLSTARQGGGEEANELLTLAGNWSLRDDPTHAWLVEYRLRRGDYGSAFAHADTLVRRRGDISPQIFRLMTTAATLDRRAVGPLLASLSGGPPWREGYIRYLLEQDEAVPLLATMATRLEGTKGRFNDADLALLYSAWAQQRRLAAIQFVRKELDRPPVSQLLVDGYFNEPGKYGPLGWTLNSSQGVTSVVTEDDIRKGDQALFVEYDGYANSPIAEQLIILPPGDYVLKAEIRIDSAQREARMALTTICYGGPEPLAEHRLGTLSLEWRAVSLPFTVPDRPECEGQYVRIVAKPGDFRSRVGVWFDRFSIVRAGQNTPASTAARGNS